MYLFILLLGLTIVIVVVRGILPTAKISNSQTEAEESIVLQIDEAPDFLDAPEENEISALQIISSLGTLVLSSENRLRVAFATLLTAANTGLNFITPWLFAETLNLLSGEDETTEIGGVEISSNMLITLLVSAYALSQVIPNLRDQTMVPVTAYNTKKILMMGTEHLLKKSLDYHVNTPFSDQIYLIQKSFSLSNIGTPLLTQIAPTVVEIAIASSVLASRYGYGMGAGLFAVMAAYTGYSALTAKPIIDAREMMLKTGSEAYQSFSDAIAQYKVMRDFGQYEHTMKGVDAALTKMMHVEIDAHIKPQLISLGHISISRLGMLLATLYMGNGVKSGAYTIQDFVILTGYLNSLSALLPAFGQAVNDLFASWPDLKFVFKELAIPDEVVDLNPETPLPIELESPPVIEFDNVTFSYTAKPRQAPVVLFKNLSFKIESGEKVILVSESGAGKTTLFNMLYGYYQPTEGTIKINGKNIAEVSLQSLQKNITLLGQSPNLFNGSIRENICYGSENPDEVSDETIWTLAETLNLRGFLESFENQLDTSVGENGKTLSGGQQQKVAILRGFMKNTSIRLMDEITAPFDSQSAKTVLESIDKLSAGVTTMMITHKLTEGQNASKIIVLAEGRVINEGSHATLLQRCNLYQHLWSAYNAQNETLPSSSTARMLASLGGPQTSETMILEHNDSSIEFTQNEETNDCKHCTVQSKTQYIPHASSSSDTERSRFDSSPLETTPKPP